MKKTNIVFVLTDDQGFGDLGCHGNPIIKTPNIDNMQKNSISFTNYHVGPTCAPTRSGLYTGHYANSTGVWHTVGGRSLLRGNEITIANVFSENNYKTALFGKWHLGDNYPYRPQDRGFQRVIYHGGGGISQTPDYWLNDYFDDHYNVNGVPTKFEGYCTDVFFNEALKFIEENRDEAFMCFITCNAPHSPYNVEKKYSDQYVNKVGTQDRANFYGMISNIDENFGKLEQKLRELELYDDTILIFMTDNGTSMYDNEYHRCGLQGGKNSEYDGGHRVPFFISYPNGGLLEPCEINRLTSHVDFMPTLMDLCGIKLEDYLHCNFHGISLKPLMTEENCQWQERVIVTDSQRLPYPVKWRKSAVMTERWRLINGTELYDINADLGQEKNIANEHPNIVISLRHEYEKWWELVSKQCYDEIPITIGSKSEEITKLSSHDWRPLTKTIYNDPYSLEVNDYLLYDQKEVRAGSGSNGYFEIEIESSGEYSFELCRWPKEEDRAIVDGIDEEYELWRSDVIMKHDKPRYCGGVSIPFTEATIEIGGIYKSQVIADKAKSVVFKISLIKGKTHLITKFLTSDGVERGAYYVYAKKIN